MAHIIKTLESDLKEIGNYTFILHDNKDYTNDNPEECDADEITIYHTDEYLQMYSYKLPKNKLVDVEWVMNKWSKSTDKTFENFALKFKELLKEIGYKNSINVYPTSYGIGIFIAYSFRNNRNKMLSDVKSILDKKEIEYKTDLSDAGWVFRYVISKKKENILKLK